MAKNDKTIEELANKKNTSNITLKDSEEKTPFSFLGSLKNSLKNSWEAIKNNQWKSIGAGALSLLTIATSGAAAVAVGVIFGGILAGVIAKTAVNIWVDKYPDGKISKASAKIGPVKNILKSFLYHLEKIGHAIKKNPKKNVALFAAALSIATPLGGIAFVIPILVTAVVVKVAYDVHKDKKSGWTISNSLQNSDKASEQNTDDRKQVNEPEIKQSRKQAPENNLTETLPVNENSAEKVINNMQKNLIQEHVLENSDKISLPITPAANAAKTQRRNSI